LGRARRGAERYLSIATDITARKRLEAQVRQQQRLESVGTLASGVAHEINNPIQGIMNYVELMRERPGETGAVLEFGDEIMHEAKRVAAIVRNLLVFARRDNDQELERRQVAALVEDTLSLIRAVLRKDQIAVEIDVPADLPAIRCRPQQIQQVIMNLVTNARDALNERYPGHDERKRVSIHGLAVELHERSWVRLSVSDRGRGIGGELLGLPHLHLLGLGLRREAQARHAGRTHDQTDHGQLDTTLVVALS
ncbi:MAG: hypothetical protein HC927_14150, partial [Deltaproteobacteria bacterium]|nr:hypothetical protein [Deltaproteobacteria bacterium]